MRWYLRLFSEFRRLEAALQSAQESDRKLFAEVIRLGNVAYDRRRALEQIVACQTPGSNATVRRMATIARNALDVASADMKTDDDGVRILLVGGGGGGGYDVPTGGAGGGTTETQPVRFGDRIFQVEVGKVPERSVYSPPQEVQK